MYFISDPHMQSKGERFNQSEFFYKVLGIATRPVQEPMRSCFKRTAP
jgi:hypothetical protein